MKKERIVYHKERKKYTLRPTQTTVIERELENRILQRLKPERERQTDRS